MKRIWSWLAVASLVLVSGMALGQDLAAVARQQRQQKKASNEKVWTNDDFLDRGAPPAEAAPATDATATPEAAGKTADAAKKDASTDDKAKAAAALQKKIDAQKAEIEMLTREADIADREFKLQVANYYADAGNSLRDGKKWAEQRDAKEKEINDKKQAVTNAKAKLDDLIEQARKADIKVNQ
jgi:hypothetical protein